MKQDVLQYGKLLNISFLTLLTLLLNAYNLAAFPNFSTDNEITNIDGYEGLDASFLALAGESKVRIISGDYNGDGKTDIALLRQAAGWSTIPIAFSTGDGSWNITNKKAGSMNRWLATSGVKIVSGDYNGDGKTDIALLRQAADWGSIPIAFSTGDGSWNITNKNSGSMNRWLATSGVKIVSGDYNGDGKTDIALLRQAAGWGSIPIAFSTGDGSWNITNKNSGSMNRWLATSGVKIVSGDYNGDGKTDIALLRQAAGWGSIPIAFSTGDGSWNITNKNSGSMNRWLATSGVKIVSGDYNGDGKTDIALLRQAAGWGSIPIAFSTGDGSWNITNKNSGSMNSWLATSGVKIVSGDYNGDGKTDIALVRDKAGWKTNPIAFAKGDGSWNVTNSTTGSVNRWTSTSGVKVVSGDYNGDGKADFALVRQETGWGSIPIAFSTGNSWNVTNKPVGNFSGWAATKESVAVIPTTLKTQKETGFRVLINGLYCLQSADGGNGTDEPYFEVFVDGSSTPVKFGSRPMNESNRSLWEQFTDGIESLTRVAQQEFWLMPGSVYAENTVRIKLWEEDDGRGSSPFVNNDDYIGEIVINKSTADNNYILKKFRSEEEGNWNLVCSKETRQDFAPAVEGQFNAINVRVPILDQGNEGACVAFATVGALTTTYLNRTKTGTSKEELFDPFKLYDRRSNKPKSGWNVDRCLNEILKNGIPFKNNPSKKLKLKNYYEYHKDGRVIKVSVSNGRISRSTIETANNDGYNKMRAVLKSGEPLIARYNVYPDFMAYAGVQGVYGGRVADVESKSGHAVFVVGYNNPGLKSSTFPTWILQNSWKPTWGKNGLCYFAEGACGFDDIMYKIGELE